MKHIKKKYLFQQETSITNFPSSPNNISIDDKRLQDYKNYNVYAFTSNNLVLKAFLYNHKQGKAIIPIPDLTLVYFDAAYNLNKIRSEQEELMFKKLILKNNLDENATNEIYRYYGAASTCLISLFTSLESFINHNIPDDKEYIKKLKHKTEIYNKDQIQRFIQFNEKITEVLPFFFSGKSFFIKQTPQNQYIHNLKEVRDEIVHTKSEKSFKYQEDLIRKVIKFNYDKAFEAVAAFMNFYQNDYIKECDCGRDY